MDPRLTTYLSERHAGRKHDGYLEREYVVYRTPDDRPWPRLMAATRRRLSTALLAMGTRLSDERPAGDIHPAEPPVKVAP